jgi:hypothetical protein
MKKLLVLLAAIAVMFPARAQDDEKFQFGMKLGMNASTMKYEDSDDDDELKCLMGPTAGLFFEIPINNFFEIRPEVLFVTRGLRWKEKEDGDKAIYSWGWGFLDIPILAKAKYGNDKIGGFVNVGPQFGIGLFGAERLRTVIDGERDSERESLKFDDQYLKRFDMGMAFGLGMECNKTGIELEARYYVGMVDSNTWDWNGGDRPSGYRKEPHRVFSVNLGWKF